MSKAKILIVEDEPLIADDIAATLERYGYTITAIVDEAGEALDAAKLDPPDIALLDINIEGDVDGIMLAPQLQVPFIFLTSYYDQKTLERAKLVRPLGYLVKPFKESELIANLEMGLAKSQQQVSVKPPQKLFLRDGQEILSVMSSDILFVEAIDNYANVYTSSDKYMISHTLKSIEEKLQEFGFLRVHRSFLINFEHIDSIAENYVFIQSHKIQIGKSYKKELIDRLSLL